MATIDSQETRKQLTGKLGCEENLTRKHISFALRDENGKYLGCTHISHGPRHDIGDTILSKMAKQLRLGTAANLVALVDCSKNKQECLEIIRSYSQ
jgi:hypothetical protein